MGADRQEEFAGAIFQAKTRQELSSSADPDITTAGEMIT
jgi:hypothetical protein